ncbi:MAG: hemerythrin domain-containing protein [Acidimicrobiales bacterium]
MGFSFASRTTGVTVPHWTGGRPGCRCGYPIRHGERRLHEVFRQALGSAHALLGNVAAGDTARAAIVASYYDNVLRFLRVHHDSEDELVWPKLLERCPTQAPLISGMISEHHNIHVALDKAASSVSDWATSTEPAGARGLASALAGLGEKLVPHLDEEEEAILPPCSEHLTIEEWGEMPGHALAHYGGDKIWLILGLLRRHMTQTQRGAMLEHMPPPARDMWINRG